ncbi:hypothetical protein RintRC_7712 [Richelia intracellularis]|nr:hypothetical protein RintRC_7712 [Richelia intracellularis]
MSCKFNTTGHLYSQPKSLEGMQTGKDGEVVKITSGCQPVIAGIKLLLEN